jgi:hypothetical protein
MAVISTHKDFLDIFNRISPSKHRYTVFTDFVTMFAISLHNAIVKNEVSVQRPHPFFTIDRNGNNSSRRLFGHVGSFSKVSVNHANGSKPFNLAVANKP